ncbi:hypothetical protein [Streptomyces sp. NPDC007074]|uniref:hypothetical protein n=1 Tax=unclassified Streptomyces TaxID=2593676 RepID=UPI0033E489F0
MKVTRYLVGAAGVALLGEGGSLLLDVRDLTDVLVWMGGAVVLHDALIAPLVLLAGPVLIRGGVRGPVRGALVVAGALTVVALPVLLRPGRPANSSVLPLDYPRNLLIAWATVATGRCSFWPCGASPVDGGHGREGVAGPGRGRWAAQQSPHSRLELPNSGRSRVIGARTGQWSSYPTERQLPLRYEQLAICTDQTEGGHHPGGCGSSFVPCAFNSSSLTFVYATPRVLEVF